MMRAVSPKRAAVRKHKPKPVVSHLSPHPLFNYLGSLNLQRDTGAEIAVLDSLLKNGTHLDLRALALVNPPDISLLFNTLVAIDLSYNCLRVRIRFSLWVFPMKFHPFRLFQKNYSNVQNLNIFIYVIIQSQRSHQE